MLKTIAFSEDDQVLGTPSPMGLVLFQSKGCLKNVSNSDRLGLENYVGLSHRFQHRYFSLLES